MTPFLEYRDLHKSFGANRVLGGLSLEIHKGETMVVLGASGSGKSVLLKHTIGLLKPDRGEVRVEGVDIVPFSENELQAVREKIAIVFQAGALFDSLTVYENVAYPLHEHRDLPEEAVRARVRDTLGLVGLYGVEEKMPVDLSGGMRKRVALARAIVLEPEAILYDEPTTGLDPIIANKINDLIMSMQKVLHVTSIVVTHDLVSAFKVGDRIALIHEGRIAFVGTRDEVQRAADPTLLEFITGGERGGGYERIIQHAR